MKPIAHMTFEQQAGQRIVAGFIGTGLNADLKFFIDTIKVGGIIVFSRNIENREQLTRLCRDAQDYAESVGQPPLIIAVDQEGGSVARLKAPDFTEFPDAARIRDTAEAVAFAETTAAELSAVGINMDMAPVLDVADDTIDSVMAKRAYSADPARVAKLGAAVVAHLQHNGIMAVAKHFPGIGRTTLDSHLELPELDAPAGDMAVDLIPFQAAIRHSAAGIMLSHIRYTAFDPQWPASLSPLVARDLLRGRMGYRGLVITDDLEMGAIAKHFDTRTAACQIMAADIDIALVCHTRSEIETVFETFLSEGSKTGMHQRTASSAGRILSTKEKFFHPRIPK